MLRLLGVSAGAARARGRHLLEKKLDKSQFSANSAFSSALPTFPYRPHSNVTMASTERDSTVIVPDNLDEVRARLEERRKKQLERAKQARADYEKRMEEEKAAAAKRAEEAKNAPKNKGDGTKEYPKPRTPGEKSPHQKQNGGGKGGSAPGVSAKIQAQIRGCRAEGFGDRRERQVPRRRRRPRRRYQGREGPRAHHRGR